jgi:hypothetical protein
MLGMRPLNLRRGASADVSSLRPRRLRKFRPQHTTVSKGQQLIDLKRALDSGAISQSAYDAERAKILATP